MSGVNRRMAPLGGARLPNNRQPCRRDIVPPVRMAVLYCEARRAVVYRWATARRIVRYMCVSRRGCRPLRPCKQGTLHACRPLRPCKQGMPLLGFARHFRTFRSLAPPKRQGGQGFTSHQRLYPAFPSVRQTRNALRIAFCLGNRLHRGN
jgi:hypothetical protein